MNTKQLCIRIQAGTRSQSVPHCLLWTLCSIHAIPWQDPQCNCPLSLDFNSIWFSPLLPWFDFFLPLYPPFTNCLRVNNAPYGISLFFLETLTILNFFKSGISLPSIYLLFSRFYYPHFPLGNQLRPHSFQVLIVELTQPRLQICAIIKVQSIKELYSTI